MSTPAVTPAESAPAPEVQEISVQDRLDHATAKELATWRQTGDIPAIKVKEPEPKPAESAPAKEIEAKPAVPPPAKSETAAASPAAKPQKQESRSDKRWKELSEQYGNLQRKYQELERKQATSQPAEVKTEPIKAEPEKLSARPKITDNDPKTGKPFETMAAFMDAVDDWKEKQFEAKIEERLSKAEQARRATEEMTSKGAALLEKSKSAMQKYPDFIEVVGKGQGLPIPAGSPVDQFIDESDHPGEILYHLQKHPEIVAEFYGCTYDPETKKWDYGTYDIKTQKFENKVSPVRQIKILEAIEREVTAPDKPVSEPVPAKPQPPKLPPPPTELSGRKAAPKDEAEDALARGDMASYMRAMNARDLAASRR